MTEEEERQGTDEVVEELHTLRDQLEVAIRQMRESRQAEQLQRDIVEGLNQIGQGLEKTARQIRESQQTKKLEAQVKKTVDTARKSSLGRDVRQGLVTGLRQLNRQLEAAIQSMEEGPEETQDEGESTL